MSEVTPAILNKVKLLLKLTSSPNAHEAEAARGMADKLIAKYNITEAQLAALDDPAPLYGEDEKVYSTIGLVGWKQQLVLAVANYFECQVVVEELSGAEGAHQFSYFAYGDEDQVKDVKFVFAAFAKKVEDLTLTRCIGRGPVYIDSYCEGVTESIRWNIQMDGIEIPEVKRPVRKVQEVKPVDSSQLTTTKEDKGSPTENRADVNKGSIIKDVMAYFKGLDDGKLISLKDVLELEVENEIPDKLPAI
jgi:hypothetical protein